MAYLEPETPFKSSTLNGDHTNPPHPHRSYSNPFIKFRLQWASSVLCVFGKFLHLINPNWNLLNREWWGWGGFVWSQLKKGHFPWNHMFQNFKVSGSNPSSVTSTRPWKVQSPERPGTLSDWDFRNSLQEKGVTKHTSRCFISSGKGFLRPIHGVRIRKSGSSTRAAPWDQHFRKWPSMIKGVWEVGGATPGCTHNNLGKSGCGPCHFLTLVLLGSNKRTNLVQFGDADPGKYLVIRFLGYAN